MNNATIAPSYRDQKSSSERASQILAASAKRRTKPEELLGKTLWALGLRYRKNVRAMTGRPDLVFHKARVVIFVDGDFWHGRDWETRRAKLENGANAAYWISKIEYNQRRDAFVTQELRSRGWQVLRIWESDVKKSLGHVCETIEATLRGGVCGEAGSLSASGRERARALRSQSYR